MKKFREFVWSDLDSLTLHKSTRIERTEKGFEIAIYNYTDYDKLLDKLQKQGVGLPTADEWSYLCGGGCRTLFPWGDGMDYAMRLHHFKSSEDEDKSFDMEEPNFFGLSIAYDPYKREVVEAEKLTSCGGDGGCSICGGLGVLPFDMEEPNFFGLSIAYDPYKREVVEAEKLTSCGGDGGCSICGGLGVLLGYLPCSPHAKPNKHASNELNGDYDFFRPIIRIGDGGCSICGGLGVLLGYLPCSPHAKPNKHASNELNGDYDFFRPIIRIDLFASDVSHQSPSDNTTVKTAARNGLHLEAYFDQTLAVKSSLNRLSLGELDCPSGLLVACDPCTSLMDAKPFTQRIPPGRYPLTMAVSVSDTLGVRYVCAKLCVSESKPVRYELGLCGDDNLDVALKKGADTGFSVDTGLATLTDVETQKAFRRYWRERESQEEGIDPYNDLFVDLLEDNARQHPQYQSADGDWVLWPVPESSSRLPIFTAGQGDGVYPTYFGYDKNDQVCGVYLPFVAIEQLSKV